jgi:hypothetical protein
MDIDVAYGHVIRAFPGEPGKYYEPGSRLALGKGCLQYDAPFAFYDISNAKYVTAEGRVYVLTHECDIEPDNSRMFNTDMLVCPVMSLEDVVAELSESHTEDQLVSFLTNLGARNISRLIYLPPISEHLPYGGVMYLNLITNGPVSQYKDRSKLMCAVSGYGLYDIETRLENHFLRPKDERLAFVQEPQV